ncbi:MAG: hypothetical protein AAF356_04785 [Planctomycetota bacterium]
MITKQQAAEAGRMIIEHGERMWGAEREVSERYATRTRLLVTLAVTLVGGNGVLLVSLLQVVVDADVSGWKTAAILLLSSVLFAGAIWNLVGVVVFLLNSRAFPAPAARAVLKDHRKANVPEVATPVEGDAFIEADRRLTSTASLELALPDEFIEWIEKNADPMAVIIASQVIHAAQDLQRRNAKERYRLRAGEESLVLGMRFTLGYALAFVTLFGLLLVLGSSV